MGCGAQGCELGIVGCGVWGVGAGGNADQV
jgi:hypothetical protein